MTNIPPDRRTAFRSAIERFLQERRDGKLEKLAPDDPKRDKLASQFAFASWIEDAALRTQQIQMVTHILKATYPDAKIYKTTSLYRSPGALYPHEEVGSHVLDCDFSEDVVGNSAALDVYAFLRIDVNGQPLLRAVLARDPDLASVLSDDPDQADRWIAAFAGLVQSRSSPASHTRAKQLYWLSGDDPCKNDNYHLLAPLYASSLAHGVFKTINEDRFGESGKAARQAKREKRDHPAGCREYPNLAIQKLGGSNTQNIGQLNNARRGTNYLLASLPPLWKTHAIREPYLTESIFPRYGQRPEVRDLVRGLVAFLATDPESNMETRRRRESYVDGLLDELISHAAELQTVLPGGWSLDARCRLVQAEQLWLDPARAEQDETFRVEWRWMDWPDEIGKRFGNWLNSKLARKLPVGEFEQRQWSRELLAHTELAAHLDGDRRVLDDHQRRQAGDR